MNLCDVAVVIPAYCAEEFIADALNSIFRQTRLPREVVVVDDGSTDQTCTAVSAWLAAKQPPFNVQLLRQENRGVPTTRNAGIRQASCSWIALLDADDIWESNHLQVLMEGLDLIPGAVASYGAGRLLERAGLQAGLYDEFWDNPSKNLGVPIGKTSSYLIDFRVFSRMIKGNFIKPSSLLFNRAAAMQTGLFNETLRSAEDREFLIRLLRLGSFVYTATPITQYRWHEDNLSQIKHAKRNIENGLRALKLIANNRNLALGRAELKALSRQIESLAIDYLYEGSMHGWQPYLKDARWLSIEFGWPALVSAIKLKHLLRIMLMRA
jgi:glycosyltransferase involved in cell wall biosynthesis